MTSDHEIKWPKKKCKQCGQANGEPCLDFRAMLRLGMVGFVGDTADLPKRDAPHPSRLPKKKNSGGVR